MTVFSIGSEYEKLSSVLLYMPGEEIGNYPDHHRIQHLAPIDWNSLMQEYDALIGCYENLGIAVTLIDSAPINDDSWFRYNLMYCRDLFFMTPCGAILASMANSIRSQEPLYAARTLETLGIPVLHSVSGSGCFEGADALWLTERLVAVGVGNRTNQCGYEQVRDILAQQGVSCVPFPSSQTVTQHLLGSLQIIDRRLALVRHEIIDREVIIFLKKSDFEIVSIPENSEIQNRQAMNIVTIAPRTVIMTARCPETRNMYLKAGIKIAAELELTQMMRGAGGLACASGIVSRGWKPR